MDGYTIEQDEEQIEERYVRAIVEHQDGSITYMYSDGTSFRFFDNEEN